MTTQQRDNLRNERMQITKEFKTISSDFFNKGMTKEDKKYIFNRRREINAEIREISVVLKDLGGGEYTLMTSSRQDW